LHATVEDFVREVELTVMDPMFLPEVEKAAAGPNASAIREMQEAGMPVPQIMRLFAYKPERTIHLAKFMQALMRGPSPLPPGRRELIAAFVSRRNECDY